MGAGAAGQGMGGVEGAGDFASGGLLCWFTAFGAGSELSDGEKAVVLGCGFFVSISFEAYRFDDYHVLADCFQLYCLVALLRLQKASSTRGVLFLCAALGVLCGLTLTTRVNDGAALLVAVAIAIACLAPSQRLLAMVLFFLASGATVALIVSLTGDSLRDYAMYSIFHAAGSKGGTGSVLTYPLRLPIHTLRWLKGPPVRKGDCVCVWRGAGVGVSVASAGAQAWAEGVCAGGGWSAAGVASAAPHVPGVSGHHRGDEPIVSGGAGCVRVGAAGAAAIAGLDAAAGRWGWVGPARDPAAGSAGATGVGIDVFGRGTDLGLYGPVGLLVVLLPICAPIRIRAEWARAMLVAVAALLLCSAAHFKWNDPYSWHTYREKPLFSGRTWFRHPVYGPMVIDRDLLQMMEPVCAQVGDGEPRQELLSLPFSYANYFCNIPPWHDDVQTFFDTTSKETIQGLMKELQASPPQWIFYQRQMATLRLHELIYNHGEPLEQRHLDELIERKLADRSWQAVYMSDYGNSAMWDNEWILIRTR